MEEGTARRGYAVCGEPRSGSSYLMALLRSTGCLGQPREYFNLTSPFLLNIEGDPADPEQQFQRMLRMGTTPNGVYGVKVFAAHFDLVLASRWAARLPNLSFVYLQRRDVLGQALSHARARQTGQWGAARPANGEATYDRDAINYCLVELLRNTTRWDFYFARNGLTPLRLVYEDVVAQPLQAVAAIAALVGLSGEITVDMGQAAPRIQRDTLTEEWRRRFLEESFDLTAFH